MKMIIDISEHNGNVDLSLAKSYIDAVICRCSWGWGLDQIDKKWKENAMQAEALSIPLFAYHFCYARNTSEAVKEANLAITACLNHNVNVLYYDIEYSKFQGVLNNNEYYNIAKSFCDEVEKNGLSVGIYANEDYFRNRLTNKGFSAWTLWIANYGINNGFNNWNNELRYNPFKHVLLHQFTSNAKKGILSDIKGIDSEGLDCNIDFGLLDVFNKNAPNEEITVNIDISKKVKIKTNATWYDGKRIPKFVFDNEYDVIELINNRAVIGITENVTGAIDVIYIYNC